MKITILTPSFNQGPFIAQTIESVLEQADQDFEHLILDGGSTDETLSILKKYPHLRWVSEKDGGQSDALSKGFSMSDGEIVGWINSDDYYDRNAFSEVRRVFADPNAMWMVGNICYVFDDSGQVVADKSRQPTHEALVENPDIVRQQPAFFRREFLERVGGWDRKYHMAMDYDLWTRMARICSPVMVDRNLAFFRYHREQKTTPKNVQAQAKELAEIMKREGAQNKDIRQMMKRKRAMLKKAWIKGALIRLGLLPGRYSSQPLRLPNKR